MTESIGTAMQAQFEGRLEGSDCARWSGGDVSILNDVNGEGGGQWTVAIEEGRAALSEGPSVSNNVTITASVEHLRAMMEGRLDPLTAQLQGKIKFGGTTPLLFRIREILA